MFWIIFVAAGRRRWVVVRGGGRWLCVVVSGEHVAQNCSGVSVSIVQYVQHLYESVQQYLHWCQNQSEDQHEYHW